MIPAFAMKIYKKTMEELVPIATGLNHQHLKILLREYGVDLSQYYQHIRSLHIENGDDVSIQNIYRFFSKIVHYDDSMEWVNENCNISEIAGSNDIIPILEFDEIKGKIVSCIFLIS